MSNTIICRVVAWALLALPAAGHAQSLPEALVLAYNNNPTLTGARASQRATDEQIAVELATGRPTAGVTGSVDDRFERSNSFNPRRALNANGTASVPFYSGGSVRNSIRAARLQAESGSEDLEATEASVFASVVAAYMDVIRDSAVATFNEQNVAALTVNLDASTERYKLGDLTRTDVAQSESRLSLARSDLEAAYAQLISSKETFVARVGVAPAGLQEPAPLPGLPAAVDEAVDIALTENSDIQAARKSREAANYAVRAAKGRIAPRLSAFASTQYINNLGTNISNPLLGIPGSTTDATAGLSFSLPIYQGGGPAALARQQAERESAAIERVTEVERTVIEQTRSSFASWRSSQASIISTEKAVETAALALESVKAENTAGTRTILDILNAEQELLNAKIRLAQARRNSYVSAFSLLAAMGRGQSEDLGLPVTRLYDHERSQRAVRGKLLDFDFLPQPQPQAPRTVEVPAQTVARPIATDK